MKINSEGLAIITQYESFRSKPYLCPAGVPTIGYGTTRYPNGKAVTLADAPITKEVALQYKLHTLGYMERAVRSMLKVTLSDNRYSAIMSLVYNIGVGAFSRSTLLKVVNEMPGAPGIRDNFMAYNKITDPITKKKVVSTGLSNRRRAEADLYFRG